MHKRVRCPHGDHEFDTELPDITRREGRVLRVKRVPVRSLVLCPECKQPVHVPHWMIPDLPNAPQPGRAAGEGP
jgi:hypothetical protein